MHTSASLTINENASSDVPLDLNVSLPVLASFPICTLHAASCCCKCYELICMQDSLDRIAPEGPHYRHDDEGSDDMPAHVKVTSYPGWTLSASLSSGCNVNKADEVVGSIYMGQRHTGKLKCCKGQTVLAVPIPDAHRRLIGRYEHVSESFWCSAVITDGRKLECPCQARTARHGDVARAVSE